MARNGSGTYTLPAGNPVITGTTISSTWANDTLSDIGTALTQSLAKDGQTLPTANLPMGGFKFTGLGAGSNAGDSATYEQLFFEGVPLDVASASTVDIGALNTYFINITGNTTITSFGTNYKSSKYIKFTGSLTLTHNATTLVLPNGQNIVTQAGDYAMFVPKSTTSGTADGWALATYYRASTASTTVASASTVDLNAVIPNVATLTGTTTITAWTLTNGLTKRLLCPAGIQLTYNATTNNLNTGGANYTTQVNDVLDITAYGSVIDVVISTASGNAVISPALVTAANNPTFNSTSDTQPTTPSWVRGLIGKYNFTSELTYVNSTLITIAHGKTSPPLPTDFGVLLVCKTANNGFAVDDVVYLATSYAQGNIGQSMWADNTNIYFKAGSGGLDIVTATSGSGVSVILTPSQWRVVVYWR